MNINTLYRRVLYMQLYMSLFQLDWIKSEFKDVLLTMCMYQNLIPVCHTAYKMSSIRGYKSGVCDCVCKFHFLKFSIFFNWKYTCSKSQLKISKSKSFVSNITRAFKKEFWSLVVCILYGITITVENQKHVSTPKDKCIKNVGGAVSSLTALEIWKTSPLFYITNADLKEQCRRWKTLWNTAGYATKFQNVKCI